MPTLPLYDADVPPSAYHHVIAPGGYEWWQFRVTPQTAGAPQLIALTFYDGRPHDPEYRRRYREFRLWPTRRMPPVPRDYRGTELALGMPGESPRITFDACPPDQFSVANDGTDLRCGDAGGFRIAVDGCIVASYRNRSSTLEMLLRPRDGARGEPLAMPLTGGVVGGHWQVTAPTVYEATGDLNGQKFEGVGNVEHRWGTSPPPT